MSSTSGASAPACPPPAVPESHLDLAARVAGRHKSPSVSPDDLKQAALLFVVDLWSEYDRTLEARITRHLEALKGRERRRAKRTQRLEYDVALPEADPLPAWTDLPLDCLTARQRVVLERTREGMSDGEISEELGISAHAVQQYRHEAVMRLQEEVR